MLRGLVRGEVREAGSSPGNGHVGNASRDNMEYIYLDSQLNELHRER